MKKLRAKDQKVLQVRKIFKAGLFFLWLLLFLSGIVASLLYLHTHGLKESIELLKHLVLRREELVALVIFGLYLLRAVIFIPISLLGTLTGIAFGSTPLLAVIFACVSATVSGIVSFAIARGLGRSWVAKHETARLKKFDEKVKARGFFTIFILRILVFIPFDLISLASGFSAIRFRDYAIATFFGMIPETALQVLVGNSVFRIFHKSFWHPWFFLVIAAIGLLLYFVARFLRNHDHFKGLWEKNDKQ